MNQDEEKLQKYRDLIRSSYENQFDENIFNSYNSHAKIAIEYLIKDAETNIRILSGSFYGEFWEKLKENLGEFLNKE